MVTTLPITAPHTTGLIHCGIEVLLLSQEAMSWIGRSPSPGGDNITGRHREGHWTKVQSAVLSGSVALLSPKTISNRRRYPRREDKSHENRRGETKPL